MRSSEWNQITYTDVSPALCLFRAPFPCPRVCETSELWSEYSFIDHREGSRDSLELNTANQVGVYGSRGQQATNRALRFHLLFS